MKEITCKGIEPQFFIKFCLMEWKLLAQTTPPQKTTQPHIQHHTNNPSHHLYVTF
jgi:hypothetical protein